MTGHSRLAWTSTESATMPVMHRADWPPRFEFLAHIHIARDEKRHRNLRSLQLRVLIVDDDPLSRGRIEGLLGGEAGVDVVGTAADGDHAVDAIRNLKPDLVFLDVNMPGLSGPEVVRTIGAEAMPATIFVTAHDGHALEAFDLAAIDYLVKPFDDERFEQALRRAWEALEASEFGRLRNQLLAALQGSGPSAPQVEEAKPGPVYLERIPIESRGKVQVVDVNDIDFIVSSGPYAELNAGEKTHLIRESMQSLEERLDPARFIRIHRSIIVRLALVDTLHKSAGGDYEVQLKNGARHRVSRTRREALERKLGITP